MMATRLIGIGVRPFATSWCRRPAKSRWS